MFKCMFGYVYKDVCVCLCVAVHCLSYSSFLVLIPQYRRRCLSCFVLLPKQQVQICISPTTFCIILHNLTRGKREIWRIKRGRGDLKRCCVSIYVCIHMFTVCRNLCMSALCVVCVQISFSKKKEKKHKLATLTVMPRSQSYTQKITHQCANPS